MDKKAVKQQTSTIQLFSRFSLFLTLLAIMLISVSSLAFAAEFVGDDLMSLQGNVVDSVGNPINNGNLLIFIYNNATGNTTAVHSGLVYNSSTEFNGVINNGRFDILLGNASANLTGNTNYTQRNLTLEFNRIYYLDMQINGEDVDFNGQERQLFQSSLGEVQRLRFGANITGGLNVSGASNFETGGVTVTAGGLKIVSGGLTVLAGASAFSAPVSLTFGANVTNGFNVSGATNLTGSLTVGTTSIFKQGVTVEAAAVTTFNGAVTATTGANITGGGLNVSGAANFETGGVAVTAGGLKIVSGGLTVLAGASAFSAPVSLTLGANVTNGLNVSGATNLTGSLTVGTTSIFKQGVTVEAAAVTTFNGAVTASTGANITGGGLNVTGGANIETGGLRVTAGGITVLAGDVTVSTGALVLASGVTATASGGNITQNVNATGLFVNKTQKGDGVGLLLVNYGNGTGLEIHQVVDKAVLNISANATNAFRIRNLTNVVFNIDADGNITANDVVAGRINSRTGIFIITGGFTVTAGLTTLSGGVTSSTGMNITGGGLNVTGGANVESSGLAVTAGGFTVLNGLSRLEGGLRSTTGANITGGGLNVSGAANFETGGVAVTAGGLKIVSGGLTVLAGASAFSAPVSLTFGANVTNGLNVSGATNLTGSLTVGTTSIFKQAVTLEEANITATMSTTTNSGFIVGNLSMTALNSQHFDGGQNKTGAAAGIRGFGGLPLIMNTSIFTCTTACANHGLPCSSQLNFTLNGLLSGAVNTTVQLSACGAAGADASYQQMCVCG